MDKKIIMSDAEIDNIFRKLIKDPSIIKDDLCNMIDKDYYNQNLSAILSSQFDADRLDYMKRDSIMTGVHYGNYDLAWLLRCLSLETITQEKRKVHHLVVDVARGISCLESYLLGNLYLYMHVYFHKAVISAEGMFVNIMVRAIDLLREGEDIGCYNAILEKIAHDEEFSTDEYLSSDDNSFMSLIKFWAEQDVDEILKNLSSSLLSRKLFKVINIQNIKETDKNRFLEDCKAEIKNHGFDPNYYFIEAYPDRPAYDKAPRKEIFVKGVDSDTRTIPYSQLKAHPISAAIREFAEHKNKMIAFPSKLSQKVNEIRRSY
jgi:hypothetical protein